MERRGADRAREAGRDDATARRRRAMVDRQLRARGIADPRVLDAMLAVPREEFVDPGRRDEAHDDRPLPIGAGQTISQPYVVARMVEALELDPGDRVLEVGAGSGYVAAILGRIAREVVAIERHRELAEGAARRLERLGFDNVRVVCGDGTLGHTERAPYDAITVAAGAPAVPANLREQLAPGGRLVIPVGATPREQRLLAITRTTGGRFEEVELDRVRFVPLIGAAGRDRGTP